MSTKCYNIINNKKGDDEMKNNKTELIKLRTTKEFKDMVKTMDGGNTSRYITNLIKEDYQRRFGNSNN